MTMPEVLEFQLEANLTFIYAHSIIEPFWCCLEGEEGSEGLAARDGILNQNIPPPSPV